MPADKKGDNMARKFPLKSSLEEIFQE